ncbi:MAG: NAD(P)/FAD-dependent oxidoreductase [Candidatus Poseidoniales archaeon]|nr:MAG: NAD(P)/FAD-dependent oxidoreductase [Candidatus Poseidoniales archaeon]
MEYDVVVIGAGPVGGFLAQRMCEEGVSVLLLEEHAQVGRPFQCAGLVNPEAMSLAGLESTVLTQIWGARIHSPSGIPVEIGNEQDVRTWSVCRKLFDEGIVKGAVNAGADLWLSSKPISADANENHVQLSVSTPQGDQTISCKLLCGADGAHSWVRRRFKMGRPKELMIGFQVEVTGYKGEPGRLDMYTGSRFSPGFFAWAIPSGETTRIGTWSKPELMGEDSCEMLLERLRKEPLWSERFSDCREVGRFCGPIPSGLVKRPMKGRVALFGDAAGLCKPTTGGGIGPGFKQVEMLVPNLLKCLKRNDFSDAAVKEVIGLLNPMRREQNRARALRDAFLTEMTDVELDNVFSIWSRPEVTELINQIGDIEQPIPLGIRMLKEVPEFRAIAKRAAKAVLWG